MSMDGSAKKRQVADDVEYFVTYEFVGVTERFIGENGIFSDDDGVFEAAAFDEAVFYEILDFLKKAERASMGDVALPTFGRDFHAAELSESAFFVGTGAGNFEDFIREQGH